MHERKGKQAGFATVGGASLFGILAVLCLTVFALLAVSTVQANRALGDRTAEAAAGYYRADFAAEETLARLRAGELPPGVEVRGGVCRYTHPISDTQVLLVEVKTDGADYEILRWQAVSAVQWETEDDLPVWNGTDE